MGSSMVNDEIVGNGIPLIRAEGLIMIMDTPKGRGVFAGRDIPANTILEICPVLVLDPVENDLHVRRTELYNYTYNWPYRERHKHSNGETRRKATTTTQAVILGLGSLFNHSTLHQNVGWMRDVANRLVTYKTLRDVKCGEELCISYGDRLTFIDSDARVLHSEDEDEEVLKRIDLI